METTEEKTDFLDVDPAIPGQNYCCISFVSPEDMIKQKELFIMKNFVKDYLNNNIDINNFEDEYENFCFKNRENLEKTFNENNDYKCSTRGVKIRGTYESYKEAELRAKVLQKLNNSHNVFVGQVGYWLPWDPNADSIADQEYSEAELNELMKSYKENQEKRDLHYKEQVSDRKKSVEESVKESVEDSLTNDDPWVQKNLK